MKLESRRPSARSSVALFPAVFKLRTRMAVEAGREAAALAERLGACIVGSAGTRPPRPQDREQGNRCVVRVHLGAIARSSAIVHVLSRRSRDCSSTSQPRSDLHRAQVPSPDPTALVARTWISDPRLARWRSIGYARTVVARSARASGWITTSLRSRVSQPACVVRLEQIRSRHRQRASPQLPSRLARRAQLGQVPACFCRRETARAPRQRSHEGRREDRSPSRRARPNPRSESDNRRPAQLRSRIASAPRRAYGRPSCLPPRLSFRARPDRA